MIICINSYKLPSAILTELNFSISPNIVSKSNYIEINTLDTDMNKWLAHKKNYLLQYFFEIGINDKIFKL